MSQSADKYRKQFSKTDTLPVFHRPEWLDISTDHAWDVSLIESDGEIVAALPYTVKQKMGLKILTKGVLSPYLGPWLRYPDDLKSNKKISFEHDQLSKLIEQLPNYNRFVQEFGLSNQNLMAFYWKGFEAKLRYSYVLENIHQQEIKLPAKLNSLIKKAEDQFEIRSDYALDQHFRLIETNYKFNKIDLDFSFKQFESAMNYLKITGSGERFYAVDKHGYLRASIVVCWDKAYAYYLMADANPSYKQEGATSLLLKKAIQEASKHSCHFDFEGSMIPGIERFFRSFGATQKTYYLMEHNKHPLIKIKSAFGK